MTWQDMQKVSVLVASKLQLKAPQKSMPATNAARIADSGRLLTVVCKNRNSTTSHSGRAHDRRNIWLSSRPAISPRGLASPPVYRDS